MMKINNDDLLKVENLDKNEYLVTKSIMEVPIEEGEKKQRKISFTNLFISSLSLKKSEHDKIYEKVRLSKSIKVLLLLALMSLMLYLLYKISDIKAILPIILMFGAIAFPLFLITVHYELCPNRSISLFQLILSLTFGILLYLAIDSLTGTILIKAIYEQTINMIVIPILWCIGELLLVAILVKMYNITDPASGILIAVGIGMGYVFCWSFYELFSCFFVAVEISVENGSGQYLMYAIIDDVTFLGQGFSNMFDKLFKTCIYYPIMLCTWSVVIGNLITLSELRRVTKKDKPTSLYLLIVLVIVLYSLSVFTTSFASFDIILKILCLILSAFISIRIESTALIHTLTNIYGENFNE